jgi:hypothetical protein
MALPIGQLSRDSVTINGTAIEFRSLSRSEALHIQGMDTEEAEKFIVARSTGNSEDDAAKWLDSVNVDDGGQLVTAILVLSALAKGTGDPKAEA